MRKICLALPLAIAAAPPAHATAGISCSTGGRGPIEVELVISRTIAASLVSASLFENGSAVPTEQAQWWLDGTELRLVLVDPNAEREELMIRARRRGETYKGRVWRSGRSRAVRCEESG